MVTSALNDAPKNGGIGQWGFLLLYTILGNKQVLGRAKKPRKATTFKPSCIIIRQKKKRGSNIYIIKFLFFKEEERSKLKGADMEPNLLGKSNCANTLKK